MLYHGDCLDWVPKVGLFDFIYVDPPFNTGHSHSVRSDRGARANGNVMYQDSWGGIEGFCSMLEPRLRVLHAALNPTGSLWLHLDFRGIHEAKILTDGVFGKHNFRGEIIWVPGNGARGKKGLSVTHQTILVYSRGEEFTYNLDDPEVREPYAETSRNMHFKSVDESGRHYRERVINGKAYRYYEDQGRRMGSVWTDCSAMKANTPLNSEATGYPTQKPLKLLDRVVRLGTNPGERVLDPMCGSGTTLMAAQKLGREWVGIDLNPFAISVAQQRLDPTPGVRSNQLDLLTE